VQAAGEVALKPVRVLISVLQEKGKFLSCRIGNPHRFAQVARCVIRLLTRQSDQRRERMEIRHVSILCATTGRLLSEQRLKSLVTLAERRTLRNVLLKKRLDSGVERDSFVEGRIRSS